MYNEFHGGIVCFMQNNETHIRPSSQITQCIREISHNAAFCNRNVHIYVHISVTECCIVGYCAGAL